MHIEVITSAARFHDLRSAWGDIYRSDAESHVFLSHEWLGAWFSLSSPRWVILGAKPDRDADFLGFFPLRIQRHDNGAAGLRLVPAGAKLADFTGFLCRPREESLVAGAFGEALVRLGPDYVELDNLLLSDKRLAALLAGVRRGGGRCLGRAVPGNGDGIDLSIAPFVHLPPDWETFLARRMRPNSRQKARRFLRKLDEAGELAVTHMSEETRARDIRVLLRFWLAAFSARKGARAQGCATTIARSMAAFHEAGLLDLCLLWRNGSPIAAHALYVDPVKRSLHFVIGACDKSIQSPPPSFLLHCYSIRRGIARGYRLYDFLRGNEAYKYSFCDEERRIRSVSAAIQKTGDRATESLQSCATQ